ncbi:MAG: DUF3040 domain-containing protein [Actinomycetota bacterium]|nr:DUF3040 domain-containing protein [Actinomycetota bacterium]
MQFRDPRGEQPGLTAYEREQLDQIAEGLLGNDSTWTWPHPASTSKWRLAWVVMAVLTTACIVLGAVAGNVVLVLTGITVLPIALLLLFSSREAEKESGRQIN